LFAPFIYCSFLTSVYQDKYQFKKQTQQIALYFSLTSLNPLKQIQYCSSA